MKIAIDGFALGFTRGTGIARYGIELARMLLAQRHETVALFGLNGTGLSPELHWPRFVQALAVRGEAGSHEMTRWGFYSALYFASYVAGLPIKATHIKRDDRINSSAIDGRLPAFGSFYNVPSIYRVSQAYSYLFSRPLRVSLGEKIDIWHMTMPLPIFVTGAKSVVTAHDVIPIALSHSTNVNLRHFRRLMWQSLSNADLVFAVSEHTKRDLLRHFDLPADKIFVTHLSVDIPAHYLQPDQAALDRLLRQRFGLASGQYFLFYGAVEPKKNVRRIIEAICMAKSDLPIVIVGKSGWLNEDVHELIAEVEPGRVIQLSYQPFQDLLWLLKGARGLVFPSLAEGFGIPLLEAMQIGCPVITSNISPQTEVCGDAALYVDPTNVADIAQAIDKLAADTALAADLTERGKQRAKQFSPERYIARVEEGYRLALSR